jgi:DeoR/GlpR family transcriptional regulator of sugar metabolism
MKISNFKMPKMRRMEIVSILQEKKIITVKELSKMYNTSYLTIRRDLEDLEREGVIKKVHGGAILIQKLEPEPVFDINKGLYAKEKDRIALEASKRILDGMVIIIESGSTCLSLVKYLNDKRNIKIATACLPIAFEICKLSANKENLELSVCGGLYRPSTGTFLGPHAVHFFKEINADIAFISSTAFSTDRGISTATYFDAEITQAISKCSKSLILLCDSSKFETHSYINVLATNRINEIITDNNLKEETVQKIRNQGIIITLV